MMKMRVRVNSCDSSHDDWEFGPQEGRCVVVLLVLLRSKVKIRVGRSSGGMLVVMMV